MNLRTKISALFNGIVQSQPVLTVRQGAKWTAHHTFFLQLMLILLYRGILDVMYVLILSPIYAYENFTVSIEPVYYLATWLVLVIFAPFVAELNNRKSPSSMLVTVINYLFFIPMTCYCGCYGADFWFFLIGIVYWACLLFFQFQIPMLQLKKFHVSHISLIMALLTICSCGFVMYISWRYAGLRFTLNFIDVYGIRAESANYAMPQLFRYGIGMMPIVLSILLAFWAQRKRYLTVGIIIVVYLFLFSFSAQKSIFFFLLLIVVCELVYRGWMLKWICGFFSLATTMAVLERVFVGTYYLLSLFIHRMFLLPIQICQNYLSFFQENPLNLFRDGIMNKFSFAELYSIRYQRIIGEYRGHLTESANGGLLADLFANFPIVPGIVLLPLILVVCFRLLDLTASSLSEKLKFPISFYYAMMFISGSWSTIVLSGGFLLTCMMLYLYPNEEELGREKH